MTLTQSDSVTTTFVAQSQSFAQAVAVAELVSEDATSDPATFYDSEVLENTNAETWNEYEIQSPLNSVFEFENLSECQSLISGRVAPVGIGGFGRIRVTDGVVSKILKCDTTKRGGQAFREFVEYSEGSSSRYLYDQLSPLFDATPDVDYFSTYDHSTASYIRNAACWAASVDLSGVAVASGDGVSWTRQRGGTLITPRHVVIAKHFAYGAGTQVRFSNAAGTVETRTVIGTSFATSTYDLVVCALDAPVTVADPCNIAGEWIAQEKSVAGNYATWYSGGLAIHMDQNARVYIGTIGQVVSRTGAYAGTLNVGSQSFASCENMGFMDHYSGAVPSEYAAMRHSPVGGDSGQPSFAIIDGEPTLLWTWFGASGGPPVYMHNGAVVNALIVVANDNAVANGHARPTDYTVTVAPDPTL